MIATLSVTLALALAPGLGLPGRCVATPGRASCRLARHSAARCCDAPEGEERTDLNFLQTQVRSSAVGSQHSDFADGTHLRGCA